jgi:hypothetical protein
MARLLQANELCHDLGIDGRAIRPLHKLKESVLRDGPPTGIFYDRSYDPGEALRAIEVAVLFNGKSFLY